MAERFKAPVLKTGKGQPFVSSNLTASARTPSQTASSLCNAGNTHCTAFASSLAPG
ncbi:MAG: hypothetical protein H6R03_398, partial [Burkholderiaceae bacterium]|nr:hypothetical protein [Burkholderiaceae bacterium]